MSDSYITIDLDPKDWESIKKKSHGNSLNGKTIMRGEPRHALTGAAGEYAVGLAFPKLVDSKGNWHFDYSLHNQRFEVKTRSGETNPRDDFDARVLKNSYDTQECDAFIFCHALWREDIITRVFIIGWLPKKEFGRLAELRRAAAAATHRSGFHQRENMMFVENRQLYPLMIKGSPFIAACETPEAAA